MLNIDSIIQRIRKIIEENDLTASSFAEKIGVQRSSISHILSGRNKPSLEFLGKIESAFDEVTFSWLLKGIEQTSSPNLPLSASSLSDIPSSAPKPTAVKNARPLSDHQPVKIVHYYADGSFDVFNKR
ncbi:MAG: helix-turn-helix domain-containing protein [Flavobacteriaceae bacterium]